MSNFSTTETENAAATNHLQALRARLLEGILRGVLVIWLIALAAGILNILEAYPRQAHLFPNPVAVATSIIGFYIATTLAFILITFNHRLGYIFRVGTFLALLYALGTFGLAAAALHGDGRVFLFAFVALAAIFFGRRAAIGALGVSVLTLATIGWLNVSGVIVVPTERQIQAADPTAWFSGTIVFVLLTAAVVISSTHLLRALAQSLTATRTALAEKDRANRLLRVLSNVNQLIVRERDRAALLKNVCEILQRDGMYAFVWIGLLDDDGVTLRLVAATGPVAPENFSARLDHAGGRAQCACAAIRTRALARIEPGNADLCPECPLRALNAQRSARALPLLRGARALGAFVVHADAPDVFDDSELILLQELADDLAFALEKLEQDAHLERALDIERRRAEQQRGLAETAGRLLTNREPRDFWQIVVTAVQQTLSADRVAIYAYDRTTDRLTCPYSAGLSTEYIAEINRRFHDAPASRLITEPRPIVIANVQTDPATALLREWMMREGFHAYAVFPMFTRDGTTGAFIAYRDSRAPFTQDDLAVGQTLAHIVSVATSNTQLFTSLERSEAHHRALIDNSAEGIAVLDAQGVIRYLSPAEERLTGFRAEEIIGQNVITNMHPADQPRVTALIAESIRTPDAIATIEYRLRHKDGAWHHYEATGRNLLDDPNVAGIVVNYRDITARKRAETTLAQREGYFRALIENAADGVTILDRQGVFQYFSPSLDRVLGYRAEEILGRSAFDLIHPDDVLSVLTAFQEGIEIPDKFTLLEFRVRHGHGAWIHLDAAAHNMLDDPSVTGIIVNYRDVTDRKKAQAALQQRATELEVLTNIAAALRQAPTRDAILALLIEETIRLFHADGGALILRADPDLVVASARGTAQALIGTRQISDTDLLHSVITTGEQHFIHDIANASAVKPGALLTALMNGMCAGACIPLKTEREVIGVLFLASRAPRAPLPEEIRLLAAISEIAGNAIHRATLHEQAEQHASEIAQAYDNTLAGWARALELRDELTEGHTRRVTELTLQLARAINLAEDELVHIRYGAILHDIGKMGIPDSILHKAGPLTVLEQEIMRRHPQYAYDMLSAIAFLRPALDIPYCHHEHWDGTGYPRGLRGEQIPLAARIFALADVWDALTSDRPYRAAWSPEQARAYILEHTNTHFDPQLAPIFLGLPKVSE
ncbi:MAG: PAS domain S-box protein [Chloroflexi bacterium]|nr:PAS domain S-box protein [Chloroflexota bacterium]